MFCNKEDHRTQNHKIVTHNQNKENIVKDILFIWKVGISQNIVLVVLNVLIVLRDTTWLFGNPHQKYKEIQ